MARLVLPLPTKSAHFWDLLGRDSRTRSKIEK
ncbi:hypothetical protein PPTG_23388 [Phytophthora nicotianae INRA-310]|uniref:Uncharacterized protein n=2 Tax=Phytophthora nicotianae TaxID=4792 RepID=W2PZ57_PHYN3|nr:hypothetical protein PPTG_23388 [Phytophthora nicotianae INRA-310]ETM42694.1 hypothetical protein L914_11711 [Phytophthora nicotianae]ETN05931.1 hypothetical protein PPTG_23388 [Phytophthora nicotianae INRA-310]